MRGEGMQFMMWVVATYVKRSGSIRSAGDRVCIIEWAEANPPNSSMGCLFIIIANKTFTQVCYSFISACMIYAVDYVWISLCLFPPCSLSCINVKISLGFSLHIFSSIVLQPTHYAQRRENDPNVLFPSHAVFQTHMSGDPNVPVRQMEFPES